MKRNQMKSWLGLAFALASCVAFAITQQSFEDELQGDATLPDNWTGDGSIVSESFTKPSIGFPIPDVNHTKVLSVNGAVVYENSDTALGASQVDFLMHVDEAGDEPSADDMKDVQIAVVTGPARNDGKVAALMIYCKAPNAESASWVDTGKSLPLGKWVRVNLILDYANQRCRVLVNGQPIFSEFGYTTAVKTDTTSGGSWYTLASVTDNDNGKITSLTFVGATKVDDVVLAQKELNEYTPSASEEVVNNGDGMAVEGVEGATLPVSYQDLAILGVDVITAKTKTTDGSDMTAVEKIEAGYEMNDGKKFEPTNMKLTKEGDDQVAMIKVPEPTRKSATPTYSLVDESGKEFGATMIEEENPTGGTIKFKLPMDEDTPKVLKFRLKATQAQVPADPAE